MRALLISLLYWIAWWLFRPFKRLIRYRTTPARLLERLQLNPDKPIVFVLATRDWSDLFVLDMICTELDLPRPSRTGLDFPSIEKAGVVYMPSLLETRVRPTELTRLLDTAIATKDYDAQVIPVSVFWGRDPGQETSLWKLIFADSVQAGRIRKLFIMLFNGHNVYVNFGLPFSFREFVDKEPESSMALRKLTRVLHFHFLRARTAALGPTLLRRQVVVDALLHVQSVRRACEADAANKGQSVERSLGYARQCAEEIAADYSSAAINFMERFLGTILWKRVFADIDLRGIERIREWAQSHEIIYMPSHRSHADYLLISYSLYHAGLVPPHIAAGENLNMFAVGSLLRRCGAFYLRRKFSGDAIYTAVFRAYVESLILRGYPIEFFPEGGRSRTGRLLAPKTGLLSMVAEAGLKQRARKVALVPVFIGYDKCWEVNTYAKELRGAKKQKESVEGLLKASKILGKSHGKAYVNFGEPLVLQDYADQNLPGWKDQFTAQIDEPPAQFKRFVSDLALEVSRRTNAAAVANPAGLTAIALLASPQRAVSSGELVEQIGHLIWLLKGNPSSVQMKIPDTAPRSVLEWSMPIARIATIPHPWATCMRSATATPWR